MLKNKYRIVTDQYNGYEAQVKFWWFPIIWWQMHNYGGITNTFSSIYGAKQFIKAKRKSSRPISQKEKYGVVAVTPEELDKD